MRPSVFLVLLGTLWLDIILECTGQRTTTTHSNGPLRTTPKKQQQSGTQPASTVAHPTQKPSQAGGGQSGKLVASEKPNTQRTTSRIVTTTRTATTTRRGTTAKGAQVSRTTTAPHSQKMQRETTTIRSRFHGSTRYPGDPIFSMLRGRFPFEMTENSTPEPTTTTLQPENVTLATQLDDNYDDMVTGETEVNSTAVTMETVVTTPGDNSTETTTMTEITLDGVSDGEITTLGMEMSTRKRLKRRKVTTTTTEAPKRVLKRRKIKVDNHEKVDHE